MIKSVLNLLEITAHKFPNKVALKDTHNSVSFLEYQSLAQNIGSSISLSFKRNYSKPIIVFVDRKIEPLIAFMGVIYSGNFYVPVDNRTPKERLLSIINVLQPIAAIGFNSSDYDLIKSLELDIKYLNYFDLTENSIDFERLTTIRKAALDVDPVYAIFTSGSTGVPKAVVISHKSVLDLSNWLIETFAFDETDILGNQTPFYFDGSVKDIYISLKTGSTLFIIPPKCFSFPKILIETLANEKISAILWATSAMVLTAKSGILENISLPELKKIFFAGEAMFGTHLNIWRKNLPYCQYINLYGPTEITVDCAYYVVDRDFKDNEVVPIGKACENKGLLMIDENNQVVEGNGPGELAVRGTGLALGYFNNPDQTAKSFIQNPKHNHYKDIIYKTGDNVQLNTLGEFEFIGRKDFQIKHMGNRIELGEIEAAIYTIGSVKQAVCAYDKKREKIVLFYTANEEISPEAFLKEISTRIPKYMFPNRFEYLQEMPMNANEKIDRNIINQWLNAKDLI